MTNFDFSRASYLAGLLRSNVIRELQLKKYDLKYLHRNPSSFTPSLPTSSLQGKYLMFWNDKNKTHESISQFSIKDADQFSRYENFLDQARTLIKPLLDAPLPIPSLFLKKMERRFSLDTIKKLWRNIIKNRKVLLPFIELFLGPASQILDRWFDSEILKTTLATDAVIGALISPKRILKMSQFF